MTALAVTVLGHDRPGIIAETTAALAGLGLNLEDSTMTLLRGQFAFMLICAGDASRDQVLASLAPLTEDGSLSVSVRRVRPEPDHPPTGSGYQLVVHGGDRPGIVASVTAPIAEAGGNITDLSTRLAGSLYVIVAEVDVPAAADVTALQDQIASVADDLGVEASLRPIEPDVL